tara:strand:- start:1061 stop:1354 length:294 start_codon:yes stop_codon:yes gene_type:complete
MVKIFLISVLSICIGSSLGAWHDGTLVANLLEGYMRDIAVEIFQYLPNMDPIWQLAIITDFLSALNTFSIFFAEVFNLLNQKRHLLGLLPSMIDLYY